MDISEAVIVAREIDELKFKLSSSKAEVERLKKVMEESLIGDSKTIDAKDRKIQELKEKLGKAIRLIKDLRWVITPLRCGSRSQEDLEIANRLLREDEILKELEVSHED
jgi:adenine specific DNA methylase Mod